MGWQGIGLVSSNWTLPANLQALFQPIASAFPSAQWTGTAASGFGTANPAAPTDPTRTTAKPAVRLLVPPNQWFTDTLDVGVIAAANDGGSLFNNLGIASVTFHYEGSAVTVDAPRWQAILTQAGARFYFGWWVRLKKPAGVAGTANLYVEATARDATMQKRVLGPFLFSPRASQYDLELEVNPDLPVIAGQRYQTLLDATSYAKAAASHNTLCTITKAGRYDIGDDGGTNAWDRTGYFNITSTVPVTIGRETLGNLQPNRLKLRLFGNVTLDRKNVLSVSSGANRDQTHWCDGITITDTSPEGRDTYVDGGVRNLLPLFGTNGAWVTECQMSEIYSGLSGSNLVRGVSVTRHGIDVVNGASCVVGSTFDNHDDLKWNTDFPAITVRYDGAEATATIARSGGTEGNGTGGGIYTVTIGAANYTFDVGDGSFGSALVGVPGSGGRIIQGWFFADLVAWLNTLPGITATRLIDPDSRANTGSLPGLRGQGFGATDIKSATLTLQSHHDKHADFYQVETGDAENVIVWGNRHTNAQTQNIFLSPINNGSIRDFFVFGNIMDNAPGVVGDFGDAASQIGRPNVVCSQVVIVQNSFPDQKWLIRNDGGNASMSMDALCLFGNNIAPSFGFTAGRVNAAMVVQGNRLYDGAAQPLDGIYNLIGGTKTSLFVNTTTGDYRPSGALLDFGYAPLIPFDMNRTPFPASAAVGALAASATLYVPPPAFTASSITGTPTNGSVLTANYTALGAEPITAAFQWVKQVGAGFADIVGQTAQTITLDSVAMGIGSGAKVICRITLTNAAGSVTAEPFVNFDGGERAALVAALTGKANSGFYDFRQTTDTGTWTAANGAGGLGAFTQTTSSLKPGISEVFGAVFPGRITLTTGTGAHSLYLLLRKDPANDAQGHIIDTATLYDPGSSATMTYPMGVDGGAVLNNRASLHAALDDNAFHILERTGTNLPSSPLPLGRATTGTPDMDVVASVVINEADFATGLVDARAAALAWLNALKVGLA